MSKDKLDEAFKNIFNRATKQERLSDEEYHAVYEWVDREKDGFESPFKEGIMKMLNNEMAERTLKALKENV